MTQLLVAARKAAGLTQNELGRRLGKRQSFVSKYETGERRLDLVEFTVVAAALNIDTARFVRELASVTKLKSGER